MNTKNFFRFPLFFFFWLLALSVIHPSPGSAAELPSATPPAEVIRQVAGNIYVAMRKLQGDVFYKHVDLDTVAEFLAMDAETLVRGFSKEEMAELNKISPMLASYVQKGDLSAAKVAGINMLTIDTARWFNVSAKGKIVSALAGDAGLLLKYFRLLAEGKDIHYKGIKFIQVQGNKAVVAITIGIDQYHSDIQPVGQMELENGVWRVKKILNAKALFQKIQILNRAYIAASAKTKRANQ